MSKELCFNIENRNLYLEQVLVDYNNIPIFFLCKDEKQYYLTLCTNIDEMNYIVTKLSLLDVYRLLHGQIPMRDVIINQTEYWDIVSGDEIYLDNITQKKTAEIKKDLLPEENACFKILTKQVKLYVEKFDCDFFAEKHFYKSNKKIDLNEQIMDYSFNNLLGKIDYYIELADLKMESIDLTNVPSYNERMQFIKKEDIVYGNYKGSKEMKKSFELKKSSTNNLLVAA